MRHLKLQQPPRSRQRVRDVAKEVGVTSRRLLEDLKEMGEYAPTAASYIEAPVIRAVHDRFGVAYDEPTQEPIQPTASVPTATGLGPPPARRRRENHPLMNEASRPRDEASDDAYRRDGRRTERARPARWSARSVEQRWAQASSDDAAPAFEFEDWKLRGFTEVERDVWIDAGLRAGQAKWAAELRDSGLLPAELQTNLHGWKVIDRLQRGEGAAAVVRLLRAFRDSRTG